MPSLPIRCFLLPLLLLFLSIPARAQYADLGTGNLRQELWWFDWAGFNMANGASRTFNTADGLSVTIRFSNVTGNTPQPQVMNTWSGAVLHLLYNFSNTAIRPALIERSTGITQFTLEITVTRAGQPAGFTLIAVDAEASSVDEVTTLRTSGSNWRTVDFFRNTTQTNNPVAGCNTQTAVINETYGGGTVLGQNPVLATEGTTGSLTVDVQYDHRSRIGSMATAFGILSPIDRGDLPASFGYAHHRLNYTVNNSCNFNPPYPTLSGDQSLYIGAAPPDADGSESNDDNTSGADEEDAASFPVYDGSGAYRLQVPVHNVTGQQATLSGWFDHNRNGLFDNGERVSVAVAPNATTATLTWNGLPQWLTPGSIQGYAFRLRLTGDAAAWQQPAGFATNGEVEDYFIDELTWCTLTVETNNDTTVCAGQPVPLLATGGITYRWNTGTYLSSQQIANPIATPLQPITYTVTGGNPQGCEASATVTIGVSAKLALTISPDITICPGASTPLVVNAPGASTFTWSPQLGLSDPTISNPSASPVKDTRYIVEAGGANVCGNKDSVMVRLHPDPSFRLTDYQTSLCAGDMLEIKATGGDRYSWTEAGVPIGSNSPSLLVLPAGDTQYEVRIEENTCHRSALFTVPVTVNPLPQTEITSSNVITCNTGQATLQARGGLSYQWDAQPGIIQLQSPNPTVTPIVNTMYHVTVTGSNGCPKRDSVQVLVDFSINDNKYLLASAFTPNNDGNNDCFGLKYWGPVTALQFEVYNRWGEKIFTTTNPLQCWDGRYKGEQQPSGGYVYVIKATTVCTTVNRRGMVMLVR